MGPLLAVGLELLDDERHQCGLTLDQRVQVRARNAAAVGHRRRPSTITVHEPLAVRDGRGAPGGPDLVERAQRLVQVKSQRHGLDARGTEVRTI